MMEVLSPGLQTTVQGSGRRARMLGVPTGGAADGLALRLANALVGNPAGAAALEITLSGPKLRFQQGAVVALCGAPFLVTLDGQPLRLWQAHTVAAGQTLAIGGAAQGMRGVLAVRGGLLASVAFGSASTDLRGGFGGLLQAPGRALQRGDVLKWQGQRATEPPAEGQSATRLWAGQVAHDLQTPLGPRHLLRVLLTPEASPGWLAALTRREWTLSGQADRMGVRLAESLPLQAQPGRVSLPTVPGLVQVPPDGRPILLLPDAGTHGGYPAPLVVAGVDVPRLGQLRPGDRVSFEVIDRAGAVSARREQERGLRQAEAALRWWWQQG